MTYNNNASPDHSDGRRVLIVEDESMVTMMLEDMLGELGYEVIATASRLDDAVEKSKSLSFDVAILDVNLRGHKTFPVAEVLCGRGLPFVFATGYGAASLPASVDRRAVLQKPFEQADLQRSLRHALQAVTDGARGDQRMI